MFSSRVRFYFCHFGLPLYFLGRANYIIFNKLVLNLMTLGRTRFKVAWEMIASVLSQPINMASKVVTCNTYTGMNADTNFFAGFGDGA